MNKLLLVLILQILCIPAVILVFKLMDRIPASFLATGFFLVTGALSLWAGQKIFGFRGFAFWGALQFMIGFALPIAAMRLLYPSQELGQLQLGPISAAKLHGFSNLSFILMMILTLVDLVRYYRMK